MLNFYENGPVIIINHEVIDRVGKKTFYGSLACLKTRGMMISFGNASGPLDPVNVPKDIQPKGLYITRPSIAQYFTNRYLTQFIFILSVGMKYPKELFNEYELTRTSELIAESRVVSLFICCFSFFFLSRLTVKIQ